MAKSVPSPGRKSSTPGRGKRVPLLIMVVHAKPMRGVPMKRGKPSKSKR
jgi:hypothetical protein